MTRTRDVIIRLKQVRQEKQLSFDKILALMEENGDYLSKSTLSRVFAEGSEEQSFKYDETLRPIANALLDIETIEENDDIDTQAYKSILKLKMSVIDDNARQIKELKEQIKEVSTKEKTKYHERLATETERFQRSLDFAMKQIELKDKRIDEQNSHINKLLDINAQLMAHLILKGDNSNEG